MSDKVKLRVLAGEVRAIDPIAIKAIRLAPSAEGMRREALVFKNERGELRVFRNLCKHIPILLDAGSRDFLDHTGEYIRCNTHGALYRRDDGFCERGPCRGKSLDPVDYEIENGQVFVIDDGT